MINKELSNNHSNLKSAIVYLIYIFFCVLFAALSLYPVSYYKNCET